MSDYVPQVETPMAVVDEEIENAQSGAGVKVGERELINLASINLPTQVYINYDPINSGLEDLNPYLHRYMSDVTSGNIYDNENPNGAQLPEAAAVTGTANAVDAATSTGGSALPISDEIEKAEVSDNGSTVFPSSSSSTSTCDTEEAGQDSFTNSQSSLTSYEETEEPHQDSFNIESPATSVNEPNYTWIGEQLFNPNNPLYQTEKSKRTQDVLARYLSHPDALRRGKESLVDGLRQYCLESEQENPEVLEVIIQLKSESAETVFERIGMAHIDQRLMKGYHCQNHPHHEQIEHVAPMLGDFNNNGQHAMIMEVDDGENTTENCTNQLGSGSNIDTAHENNMVVQSTLQSENIHKYNNESQTEVNLPSPSQGTNNACKSIPKKRCLRKIVAVSKKLIPYLQKVLTRNLLKTVRSKMSKAEDRAAKIKAGGKILLRAFFSTDELRRGTVSGKKTANNKKGIKYNETKVDDISRVIECLLNKPTVGTYKEYCAYQKKENSTGLSGTDHNVFYQAVMVDYANQIRNETKQ